MQGVGSVAAGATQEELGSRSVLLLCPTPPLAQALCIQGVLVRSHDIDLDSFS